MHNDPAQTSEKVLFSPSDDPTATAANPGAEHLQRTSDEIDLTTHSNSSQSTQDPKPSITLAGSSSASDPSNYATPSSSSFRNGNGSNGNSSNGNGSKSQNKDRGPSGGAAGNSFTWSEGLEKQEQEKLDKALEDLRREMGGIVPDSDV